MSDTPKRSQRPKTAAQRASESNRISQMEINVRLGRPTPPPRDPNAPRQPVEEPRWANRR